MKDQGYPLSHRFIILSSALNKLQRIPLQVNFTYFAILYGDVTTASSPTYVGDDAVVTSPYNIAYNIASDEDTTCHLLSSHDRRSLLTSDHHPPRKSHEIIDGLDRTFLIL
jgi:hypothetical protein